MSDSDIIDLRLEGTPQPPSGEEWHRQWFSGYRLFCAERRIALGVWAGLLVGSCADWMKLSHEERSVWADEARVLGIQPPPGMPVYRPSDWAFGPLLGPESLA
jgi:hypothetical protein